MDFDIAANIAAASFAIGIVSLLLRRLDSNVKGQIDVMGVNVNTRLAGIEKLIEGLANKQDELARDFAKHETTFAGTAAELSSRVREAERRVGKLEGDCA